MILHGKWLGETLLVFHTQFTPKSAIKKVQSWVEIIEGTLSGKNPLINLHGATSPAASYALTQVH